LTDVVENEFLKSADVRGQVNLIQFYQSFVADFASKMNQITFVRIAVEISKQLPGKYNTTVILVGLISIRQFLQAFFQLKNYF
jgi:hypothetical protein